MGKAHKKVVKVLGIVVLSIVAVGVVGFTLLFPPPISMAKMERIFQKDHALLVSVAEYFQNSEYSSILINHEQKSGFMTVFYSSSDQLVKVVPIDDPEIVKNVDALLKRDLGYIEIGKYDIVNRNGNTVRFQRWAVFDNSRGIVYTIDGTAPEIQFLTYYAPLSEEHWYYYETDFNEYRRRMNE